MSLMAQLRDVEAELKRLISGDAATLAAAVEHNVADRPTHLSRDATDEAAVAVMLHLVESRCRELRQRRFPEQKLTVAMGMTMQLVDPETGQPLGPSVTTTHSEEIE
jgi:hypothetical protein